MTHREDDEDAQGGQRNRNREQILARRKRFMTSALVGVTAATATAVVLASACATACLKVAAPPHDASDTEPSPNGDAAPTTTAPDASSPPPGGPSGPRDAGAKG